MLGNAEAAKEMNDLQSSSMKVGINLEQMEEVLKEPVTIEIGSASPKHIKCGCCFVIKHRWHCWGEYIDEQGYEKAHWSETSVKSKVPEPTANMYDNWFYVHPGTDRATLCDAHFNGDNDENLPTDYMRISQGCGKRCVICSANETANQYLLWPPDFQREQILTMAARLKNLITKLAEEGNPVTDPHVNLVQFLKEITMPWWAIGSHRFSWANVGGNTRSSVRSSAWKAKMGGMIASPTVFPRITAEAED